MLINIQEDIQKLHAMGLLEKLLVDKTTKKNIMWATDAYSPIGTQFERNESITAELLTSTRSGVIKNRARKAMEQRSERTRQRAEVFTPLWICKKMCDYADEVWDKGPDWKKYVDSRRLEITCGEAPFLVSRYDVETGEAIPIADRIGLLDRKLRMVGDNAVDEQEWMEWTIRAFHSVYGYEFQGDNVLIARVNLLMTFEEYLRERWGRRPTKAEYEKFSNIIAWNIWQMDGLSGTVPYGTVEVEREIDWFGMFSESSSTNEENPPPSCRIYNWRSDYTLEYLSTKNRGGQSMKFDFVIGNPPYQDETIGEQKTFAPPIYHLFIDEAYKISNKVELIHPARFLFNAGNTPKAWNEKMLHDPHLKVLLYEQDSGKVFPNTFIIGGIAVTYHDNEKNFGAIETFTSFPELNLILQKVFHQSNEDSLEEIIYNQLRFDLDALYAEFPEFLNVIGSDGKDKRFRNNIFEKISLFSKKKSDDTDISIIGVINGKREWRYISQRFVDCTHENLWKYKAIISSANGASGMLGEEPARITTVPFLGEPGVGYTQTFISIGSFENIENANNCIKFLKSKFARVMLGILKVTQDNKKPTWKYVPLQDFTSASDIDWTKSIPEIDQQLYTKYGLDEKEIEFIETHVKEME